MFTDDQMRLLTRLMDVSVQRQRLIQSNLANSNTPGYKSQAIAFEDAFRSALEEGGVEAAMQVRPEVYAPLATPAQTDGNDVAIEREALAGAQNQMLYNGYIAMTKGKMRLMTTAITAAPGG